MCAVARAAVSVRRGSTTHTCARDRRARIVVLGLGIAVVWPCEATGLTPRLTASRAALRAGVAVRHRLLAIATHPDDLVVDGVDEDAAQGRAHPAEAADGAHLLLGLSGRGAHRYHYDGIVCSIASPVLVFDVLGSQ